MNKKILTAAVVAVAAMATYSALERYRFSERVVGLEEILNDPASAQYKKTSIHGNVTCGNFNARNSSGGYVGFKRFISHMGGAAVEGSPISSFSPKDGHPSNISSTDALILRLQARQAWNGVVLKRTSNPTLQLEEMDNVEFSTLWNLLCSGR